LITECFTHCPGVGPETDIRLREKGFSSWDDCFERIEQLPLGLKRRGDFLELLKKSREAKDKKDIEFFVKHYPSREQWRVMAEFFDDVTFFDIETTGLSWYDSHASVISVLHEKQIFTFRYGENLDDFLSLVDEARLLVTFNGNCFDIPFLEKTFNVPSLGVPHVDLRWVAYYRGYRGGLKYIEEVMGIRRPESVEGIDGFEAVDLYYRWQAGDLKAGRDLVRYCTVDTLTTCLVSQRLLRENGYDCKVDEPDDYFCKFEF